MKSLHIPNKGKRVKIGTKFKLNYKHSNNDSSSCSVECLTKLLKSKARKYHRPYSIIQGSVDGLESDPLLTLVQRKQEYQLKMETVKYMYHKYQKKFQVCKQFESYHSMQDLLSHDPDKYFSSNYNWYYTGGNLTIQKIDNTDLMFYTTNNAEFSVAKLRKKYSGWSAKKERILSHHSSDIYQVDSVHNDFKTFVGVRQKNDILLYDVRVNDNEDVVCELANIQNTDVPFVSMSLNTQSHEDYAAVNAKQSLQIWDLFTLKPVYEYQLPHDLEALEGDCFAQVAYYNNNILTYINRNHFCIFDKRSNSISSHFKLDSNDLLEYYDRFVNICPRQNNPSQYYISTFRDVLVLDVRFRNVVNKYSHGFTSAPYISDLICNRENSSIFYISSCKPDEKLILEQNQNSYCVPVSLPTLTDSFESSLLSFSNMDMSLSISERLEASTIGTHLWSSDDETFAVFSANVLGDIYCHEITKSHAEENNHKRNKTFQKWNNRIVKNRKMTNQMNFVDKVVLNDVKFTFDSEPPELTSVIKNKRLQDCIQNLKKSQKGFSAKICDLWENVSESNVLDGIEEIPADVSVRNWLSKFCPDSEEPVP